MSVHAASRAVIPMCGCVRGPDEIADWSPLIEGRPSESRGNVKTAREFITAERPRRGRDHGGVMDRYHLARLAGALGAVGAALQAMSDQSARRGAGVHR